MLAIIHLNLLVLKSSSRIQLFYFSDCLYFIFKLDCVALHSSEIICYDIAIIKVAKCQIFAGMFKSATIYLNPLLYTFWAAYQFESVWLSRFI